METNIDAVLIPKNTQKSKEKSKVGEKLIEKEKIESGKVKLNVIVEYLKACRLWLSLLFVLLYVLSSASDMGSNFWLSDWSNEVAKRNQTMEPQKSKYFRLGIYALLGFSKCEYTQNLQIYSKILKSCNFSVY